MGKGKADFDTASLTNLKLNMNKPQNGNRGNRFPRENSKMLCIVCEAKSYFKCDRCSDSYCSAVCQLADWSKHRYICFPMPNLILADAEYGLSLSKNNGCVSQKSLMQKSGSVDHLPHNGTNVDFNKFLTTIPSSEKTKFKNSKACITKPSNNFNEQVPASIGKAAMISVEATMNNSSSENKSSLAVSQEVLGIDYSGMPKSKSVVAVLCVVDARTMYIREVTNPNNSKYLKLLGEVQNYEKKARPLTSMPKFGNIVLAYMPSLNAYARAYVINVKNPKTILISYLDYGCTDTVPMTSLKELSTKLQQDRCYITKVRLDDVAEEYKENKDAIQYLKSLILDNLDFELVYNEKDISADEVPMVKLVTFTDKLSVGTQVNNIITKVKAPTISPEDELLSVSAIKSVSGNLAAEMTVGKPIDLEKEPKVNLDQTIMLSDIEKPAPQYGKKRTVIILDDTSFEINMIPVINKSDLLLYERYLQKINLFSKKLDTSAEPYEPKINELCMCKVDGVWYRAHCHAAYNSRFSVTLMDYGRFLNVSIKQVRRFPADLSFKSFIFTAKIKDLPVNMDEKQFEKLKTKLPLNEEILVDEITPAVSGEDYCLVMPTLISQLEMKN